MLPSELLKAANWIQGSMYATRILPEASVWCKSNRSSDLDGLPLEQCGFCMLGATEYARYKGWITIEEEGALDECVSKEVGTYISFWNDVPGRLKIEVVSALQRAEFKLGMKGKADETK